MMKKIVIFGAGNLGEVLASQLKKDYEILGFLDNNSTKWGNKIGDLQVLGNATVLQNIDYDEIVIASTMRFEEIKKGLMECGIPEDKFNVSVHQKLQVEIQARVNFLRDFCKEREDVSTEYAVAEGGVFQGMFAAEINKYFPNRKLYLFDTFEGFDKRDVEVEIKNNFSNVVENYYSETTVETVMQKMQHPEQVVICKGYFPETIQGLEEQKYLFVNLDFDLYAPILSGLEYFYPRMADGGVMLIHDYFTEYYHGVKEAVDEFEKRINCKLKRLPIGDGISTALVL